MKILIKFPAWNSHSMLSGRREFECELTLTEAMNSEEAILSHLYDACGNHPDDLIHIPEWTQAQCRSMSVGDFVKVGDNNWKQVAPIGWNDVDESRVQEVMALAAYQPYSDIRLRAQAL